MTTAEAIPRSRKLAINALPGIANKLGARMTTHVATSFPSTELRHGRYLGLPIRRMISTLDRAALRAEARSHFGLHPDLPTVLYAGALTLLAAVIAGVVPALKVTRGMGTRLKQGTAGGGGARFGGVWTAVIVSQVAVTVAFPVAAYFTLRGRRNRHPTTDGSGREAKRPVAVMARGWRVVGRRGAGRPRKAGRRAL